MLTDHPFDTHFKDYDRWFDDHANIFHSELLAIRNLLPEPGDWVEVGVGSGRFAAELGIECGVEPAGGIASLAASRGIRVLKGIAEDLPLPDASTDALFYITSLCFMPDLDRVFSEAVRVLRPSGIVVAAFLPKDSPIGAVYDANAAEDRFYAQATLHTKQEVVEALSAAGLDIQATVETLTSPLEELDSSIEEPTCGMETGSFVVIRAQRRLPEKG